jgi:hypothetical protein
LEQSDRKGKEFTRNAYELLKEKASKIKDPNYRASFLSNIPCHRELADLYQRVNQPDTLPDSSPQTQR